MSTTNSLVFNDQLISVYDYSVSASKPFLLFDSYYDTSSGSTVFKTRIFPGQDAFESQLSVSLDQLRHDIDAQKMARRPIGTLIVTDDYELLEDPSGQQTLKVNNFQALVHEMDIMSMASGLTEELRPYINDLLRWIGRNDLDIDGQQYGRPAAEKLGDDYATYGYVVNWDELLADPMAEPEPVVVAEDLPQALEGTLLADLMARFPCPPDEKYGFHIEPKLWRDLVYNRFKKLPMLLVGPTGCGKTELLRIVAMELNEVLYIQDMSTVQDAQSSLLGTHRLDESGHSVFDYAPFVDYVKSGSIVLLDELNRGSIASGNYLLPLLDGRRYLPVDMAGHGDERHIMAHEETWFIATANVGAEYGSTQAIDRALEDRLLPAELDYLDVEQEINILTLRTGIDGIQARTLVTFAHQTREEYKDEELTKAVSVRHTLAVAQRVADGYGLLDAVESVIYPLYPDGEDSERSKVRGMCASF